MQKLKTILLGIILIGIGSVFALNAFGVNTLNILFTGWWTLFIIVPCFIGLITDRDKTGSVIGLTVGVLLLLCERKILAFRMFWKLLVPAIILIIGLKLIIKGLFFSDKKENWDLSKFKPNMNYKSCNAVFSGSKLDYTNEVFNGANLNAMFGGVDCNLRNAIIENDCFIEANALFGGIDIIVPDNVNIKISSNSLFGGVDSKKKLPFNPEFKTLFIKASALFGGIDIK